MAVAAGIYRGVCVDTADPERLGRIRVQVPQLLGERASGWALPAWSLHDLTIWPEDRLPRPGQGVWVQFEGPDRLTWVSVFGPQEFSQQGLDADPANYATATALRVPSLVAGLSVPVVGTVLAAAGAPEGGSVVLETAESPDGPWAALGGAQIQRSGAWSVNATPDAGMVDNWFRAAFAGQEPYTASVSDPVQSAQGTLEAELSMTAPSSPSGVEWRRPTLFGGFLLGNNRPLPGLPVLLLVRAQGEDRWQVAGSGTTEGNGSWSVLWTRQGEAYSGTIEITAYFAGDSDRMLAFAPEPPMVVAPVEVPTVLTIDPVVPVPGQDVQITGTLSSAHGAPTPSPSVALSVRAPSALEGPQQSVQLLNAALSPEDDHLRFTAQWRPASVSADISASFPGTWVYLPSTDVRQVLLQRAAAPQGLVLPDPLDLGVPFTATATINDVHGQPVEVGTAVLQWRQQPGAVASGVPADWTDYGDPAPVGTNGLWTAAVPGPTGTGQTEWRVRYPDNSSLGLLEGFGGTVRRDVVPAAPVLVTGTITHTSAAFSWDPVPAAVEYEVMRDGSLIATTAGTSHSDTGLSTSASYTYTVRATDGSVYGPASAGITASTGRPEVRKIGSLQRTEKITSSGSWRPDLNRWVQDGDYSGASYGDILMGYYSSSASINYGVMNYNGAGFRSWVSSTYGSDVLNALKTHANWDRARLYMHRSDSSYADGGASRATPIILYVTNAIPRSSGRPLAAGGTNIGSWNRAAAGVGNYAKTVDIPYPWWGAHVLMNETTVGGLNGNACRGFLIYQNSKTNYSRYLGRRTADTIAAQLTVNCSWNFVTVSYVAAKWS